MEINEIKELLACYRPSANADGADERVAEALERVNSNSELAAWLEEEQAFDCAFAAKLSDTPAPSSLRDGILAKMREAESENAAVADSNVIDFQATADESTSPAINDEPSASTTSGSVRSIVPVYGWFAAAAAVVAVALVIAFQFEDSQASLHTIAEFRDEMASRTMNGQLHIEKRTHDLIEVRDWLKGKAAPAYGNVPDQIVKYQGMGCNVLEWEGNKVALVCFRKNQDPMMHLFVISKKMFKKATSPADHLDKIQLRHNLQTGGWIDDKNVYLVVGGKPDVNIKPALP